LYRASGTMERQLLPLLESLLAARGCTSAAEIAATFGVSRRAALAALRALVEHRRAVRLAFKAVPTAVVCDPRALFRATWVQVKDGVRVPVGPVLELMCRAARSGRGGVVSIRPAAVCAQLVDEGDATALRACVDVVWSLVALMLGHALLEKRSGMGGKMSALVPRDAAVAAICAAVPRG